MALTATIALNRSTAPREQKVTASVTVSNSGGADVAIKEIVPKIKITNETFPQDASSVAPGKCLVPQVVPAGGSALYIFDVCFHASSFFSTYDVGCLIYGADGSIVSPTPATIPITQS